MEKYRFSSMIMMLIISVNSDKQYLIFEQEMGNTICTQNVVEAEFTNNPLEYAFGEDNGETKIPHEDTIICRAKEIEHNLKDCQQRLRKSQKLFKDPNMKTDPVILRSLSSKQSEVRCTFQRPYTFLSDPSTGRGKKYKIIDFADFKPSQIVIRDEVLQYFGVFLCFMAENPHLISQILLTEPNTYGVHAFKLNIGSKKEFLYVDDYIICSDRLPLFSQPIKGIYMWPCLLEKAWFKVKGNSAKKIQKNSPEQVFNTFLSYPMKPYLMKPNDNEYNHKLLQNNIYSLASQKGCIVTTKKQPLHKIGLSGRKHFYLLKNFDFQGKRLYYLRNPCYGSFDFRGTHRIISQELSFAIKEQTGEFRMSDGNFVLDEAQFIEQADEFFIIHYTKSSQVVSEQQITLDEGEEFFISTDLKNDGLISICFSQQPNYWLEKPYSPLVYHMMSLSNQQIVSDQKNEEGCFGVRNTFLLDNACKTLKQGQYLIRLKKKRPNLKKGKKEKVASDKIVITAPFRVRFDYKQFNLMKEKFNNFLKEQGKRSMRSNQIRKNKLDFQHKSLWLGDLLIIYVQKLNQSKKQIRIEVQFPEIKNLECLSHEIKKQFTAIPPFQVDLLIIFEKIDLIEETVLGKYIIESF